MNERMLRQSNMIYDRNIIVEFNFKLKDFRNLLKCSYIGYTLSFIMIPLLNFVIKILFI